MPNVDLSKTGPTLIAAGLGRRGRALGRGELRASLLSLHADVVVPQPGEQGAVRHGLAFLYKYLLQQAIDGRPNGGPGSGQDLDLAGSDALSPGK